MSGSHPWIWGPIEGMQGLRLPPPPALQQPPGGYAPDPIPKSEKSIFLSFRLWEEMWVNETIPNCSMVSIMIGGDISACDASRIRSSSVTNASFAATAKEISASDGAERESRRQPADLPAGARQACGTSLAIPTKSPEKKPREGFLSFSNKDKCL